MSMRHPVYTTQQSEQVNVLIAMITHLDHIVMRVLMDSIEMLRNH